MKIEHIDVSKAIASAKQALKDDKKMSASTKLVVELLLMVISMMAAKLGMNSSNSSKPPSSDSNRKKETRKPSGKNPGGQKGRKGTTLAPVKDPDEVERLPIDKKTLPQGEYSHVGYEKRQVVEIRISRIIKEYQAEIVQSSDGTRYTASFPKGINAPIQYGNSVKAHAVYMNQYQMIPFHRTAEYFRDYMDTPISVGSLVSFNKQAYEQLEVFDALVKQKLIVSPLIHADETSINVNGKRIWLHSASNDKWAHCFPHEKRGKEAMDEIGILPHFTGTLCHDHWKSYYAYKQCQHVLCNAHHIRELQGLVDSENLEWAKDMQDLLRKINHETKKAGGALPSREAKIYRQGYRRLLQRADGQHPPPIRKKGQKGRLKQTKARNLLDRLRDYEDDTLRSMEIDYVPFTNNLGENDIRMSKVKEKISGCFRSLEGAYAFCRTRSYLLSAQKQKVHPAQALEALFNGKWKKVFE